MGMFPPKGKPHHRRGPCLVALQGPLPLTYEDAVAFLTRYDIAIPPATTEIVELRD